MILCAALLFLYGATAVWAASDAEAIVRRSIELHERNVERVKNYTYRERTVTTGLDSHGRAKASHSTTHEIIWLYGRPYSRLIEKDGEPLSPAEQRREETRERKEMEKRRKAAEDGDSRERREYEKREAEQRRMIADVARAFNFTLAGEDVIDGRPVYVIDAEPRPGYKPFDRMTSILPKLRGRIWIDKADYQWVRVKAQVIDTFSIGWILARLKPGSSLFFEQRRVNDELWLPAEARIMIDGRIALLKKVRQEIAVTYSNYKKFQADSKVVATGSLAPR